MGRVPLGVCGGIVPFNFPAMIPLWMFPLAITTGNTFILKPSERVPTCAQRLVELLEQAGSPPGVVNIVHGGHDTVNFLCDAPNIKALSFVGSNQVTSLSASKRDKMPHSCRPCPSSTCRLSVSNRDFSTAHVQWIHLFHRQASTYTDAAHRQESGCRPTWRPRTMRSSCRMLTKTTSSTPLLVLLSALRSTSHPTAAHGSLSC